MMGGMPPSTAIPFLVEMVTASTRYLGALSDLSDDDVRTPSLLPGWTRAHVAAHLARNADAFCNILHGAESGEVRYMYDSPEQRDADIEAGASASAHDLRVDASASAGRLVQAINELDVRHQDAPVAKAPGAPTFPAKEVATLRLVELEVHLADLGIGYTHGSWDRGFAHLLIDRAMADRAHGPAMVLRSTDSDGVWRYGVQGQGPEVSGRARDLAWWVLGRGDGSGLTSDADRLPTLDRWR